MDETIKREAVFAITELIITHGVPAALKIIRTWPVEEPTLDDIHKLSALVPPPESYFEDKETVG